MERLPRDCRSRGVDSRPPAPPSWRRFMHLMAAPPRPRLEVAAGGEWADPDRFQSTPSHAGGRDDESAASIPMNTMASSEKACDRTRPHMYSSGTNRGRSVVGWSSGDFVDAT